ncbi:S24 family peptidase [Castellaniella denitrificans]|uniref:Transcriptional regulator n=1 Tax=Castellaniella denitrificans TaxID=56119 RepID=A0ABT4M6X6_9BURK|nr:S24 family peptidase [Castellaniella denitrificans]MCZ4331072.1 transcriptional regulator [Castellaniella denitrificans]
MVEYKDRLAEAMKNENVSTNDLAGVLGMTYQAVKKVLDGKSGAFNAINHAKAAAHLRVTSDWLALGIGPRNVGDEPQAPESKKSNTDITIRQYDAAGSMGHGLDLPDQPGVIQNLRVNKEWLSKNIRAYSAAKNLCVVTGFGDSMQPMFNPGDPLLVDLGVTSVEFDAVYFFRVDNLGYVKRLQRIPTEDGLVIRAISENKDAYDPFNITEKMDFQVIGRVLKVWRSQEF